jgi:hypothetical protein
MADLKKGRERRFAEKFQAARPDLVSGVLENSESPDFRFVGRDGSVIGIEVTCLFHSELKSGDPEQARDARAHRIVQRARARHEQAGGVPLVVDVLFDRSFDLTRSDEPSLVDAVRHIVSRNTPPPGESKEEDFGWENRSYFPETIHSVFVTRFDLPEESNWTTGHPGIYIPALSADRLGSTARKKALKIPDYRRRCDRIWLLIVIDIGPSSTWTVDQDEVSGASSCGFDRAFILGYGNVFELSTRIRAQDPDQTTACLR